MRQIAATILLLQFFSLVASGTDLPLMFEQRQLAEAAPDEFFFGIGNTNNLFIPGGINPTNAIPSGAVSKVNQAYVWGLTRAGNDLWFGTGANVNVLVSGAYMGLTNAVMHPSRVAEYGESAFSRAGIVPPEMGDWRPSDIFVYPLPNGPIERLNDQLPPADLAILNQAVGLRSAGTSPANSAHTGGVVILAGPSLSSDSIVMIAFDAATRSFVATQQIAGYSNIRKWICHNGSLYTAVTTTDGDGAILRWRNNPDDPNYPLAFDVVGRLDNGGAELTIHEGRLFVGTWPGIEGQQSIDPLVLLNEPAGIYRSPAIPANGLTTAHASSWEKVWDVMEYDPDVVCAAVTGIGALHSFDGQLYWGTMQVPGISYLAHVFVNGEPIPEEVYPTQLRSWRSISIFRDDVFQPRITKLLDRVIVQDYHKPTLLYGESQLWARELTIRYLLGTWTSGDWALQPTSFTPLYGTSGFGNRRNNYTWTMSEYNHQLFVGTMDATDLDLGMPTANAGSDLWCFESGTMPARQVSGHGLDNYSTYGIRTMVASEDGLYLGMANPMNLLTDPTDQLPEGGWKLIRLRQRFIDSDWDNLADVWETEKFGSITNNISGADSDGDTISDRDEFIAGTDPLNRNEFLQIEPKHETIEWKAETNRLYHILYTPEITNTWQIIGTVTGANETVSFELPPRELPAGYFRIEALLNPDVAE